MKLNKSNIMITQTKLSGFIIAILAGTILLLGQTLEAAEKAGDFNALIKEAKEISGENHSMDKLVSLDLRALDITDALKYLALQGGMNIVVSKNVTGRITFMLNDVPLRDVFDVILRSNSLAYDKLGDVYNVMTEKEYQNRYGKQFSDVRQVKIFHLKYAIPGNVFILIDALKSEIGRLVVDVESGTVLVMDTPEKTKEIERAIAALEKKTIIQVFELKYAKAKDIEEQLKDKLDVKKVGTVKADERSNRVVVQTLPERMKDVEELISSLDTKTRQVLIDAKIVKVTLLNDSAIGVEWEGLMDVVGIGTKNVMDYLGNHPLSPLNRLGQSFIDESAGRVASITGLDPTSKVFTSTSQPTAGSKTTLSEKIYFGKTGRWEAVLSFLNTIGHTKILSNPKLAIVNNQEAKILVGKREAYVTTTTTTGQTTSTISEDVTFIDVGIQLSVTPTINADGYVTMKIRPEISSVVGSLITPSKNVIPIVDTSSTETTVMIKDGSTIVIGGLRKDEEVYSSKQVPFFSKIPLIGNLFKSDTSDNEQTELLILITPHIIDGDMLLPSSFEEVGGENTKSYRGYEAESTSNVPKKAKEEGLKTYRGYSP